MRLLGVPAPSAGHTFPHGRGSEDACHPSSRGRENRCQHGFLLAFPGRVTTLLGLGSRTEVVA
jgi:hypothetical protein